MGRTQREDCIALDPRVPAFPMEGMESLVTDFGFRQTLICYLTHSWQMGPLSMYRDLTPTSSFCPGFLDGACKAVRANFIST